MVFGIGVDSAEITRVAASLAKPGFLGRVYSPKEQALLESLSEKRRAETAAANFAAKEAFLKAAGRGLGGFALSDIATLRREGGAPYLVLAGGAAAFCEKNTLTAFVSLTHEAGVATAFVLLDNTREGIGYL